MLGILNLPPQTIKHALIRKWPIQTHTHTHTHTHHTHTHTHAHQGSEKEQLSTQARLSFSRDITIMTYHDSVLRYNTKILVQSSSK